jgi:N-acetylneuraminic acid mutarotase
MKVTLRLLGLALSIIVLGSMPYAKAASGVPSADDGGTWTGGVPMHSLRAELSAETVGGKIYAIGGMYDWDRAVTTIESYDPASKIWTTKGSMLKPRWGMATAVLNDKIYVIGGYFGGGHYANEVEEYNPTTNTWRVLASLPETRVCPAAAALNGKIYQFGTNADSNSPIYEYDASRNVWTPRAHMKEVRYCLAGAALDGKLYAIGGYSRSRGVLSSVEVYDPAADVWTTVAPMSAKRFAATAVAMGGKIYVMGGSPIAGLQGFLSDVEEYDPKSNTWRTMTPMPTARSGLAGVAIGDKIYAIGGSGSGGFVSVVEEFLASATDCSQVPAVLSALISGKSGTQDARKWTITVSNSSYCPGQNAQVDGLKLTQTYGIACTPVITSPTAFPLQLGDIAAQGKASGDVTINFSGCASTARFTAKISYSANDGAVKSTKTLNNQFR